MNESQALTVVIDAATLEALERDADRYRWVRNRAVRIQGSDVWYAGGALDIRVDIGRDHVAIQTKAKQIND